MKIARRLDELHLELLDPRALDLEHPEAKAVVLDLVALGGGPAEQAEDEARDRVVVLGGELDSEFLVEVVDREGPVDTHGLLVDLLDRLVGKVELVLDLPDDLLEQILERDEPGHRPVLVDDDRSEEHTSELQSRRDLVCRLLLEKKKK